MFQALERARAAARRETGWDRSALEIAERQQEYERLKVMLLAAGRVELRTAMLVSTMAGEGVSSVTLGLATGLAEDTPRGVLVVELGTGDSGPSEHLGLKPRVGLSEVLTKEMPSSEAVVTTPIPRLFLLGRGRGTIQLSQPRRLALFEEVVGELGATFDHLVFDGGSLENSPESLLVASRVEAVVLVVEAERTGTSVVREASENLRQAGAAVAGVVLNRRRDYLPGFVARRL